MFGAVREAAADRLAEIVDRRLTGTATRDELQEALFAYWRTIPPGPAKSWSGGG